MSTDETHDIQIASRVSKTVYDRLLRHQQKVKQLTGIEPSVSEIVRALVEKGLDVKGARNGGSVRSRGNGRRRG